MKVPPDYYNGLQATYKGHALLLIPVSAMGKCKQAFNHAIIVTQSLIIHEQSWDSRLSYLKIILVGVAHTNLHNCK